MNEEERAEWLARAIDDLLKAGRQSEAANEPPAGLEAEELRALMGVARARLETARETAHTALQYEGAIWKQLLSRLDEHFGNEYSDPEDERNQSTNAGQFSAGGQLETEDPPWNDADTQELREIAALRRQMAEEAASLAEQHRDAVWRRLQSRIQKGSRKASFLSFLRTFWTVSLHKPTESSDDETLDSLIRLARERKGMSGTASATSGGQQGQLWARIMPGVSNQRRDPAKVAAPARPRGAFWPRRRALNLVAATAAAALFVAAVGPLPATGLAGHPAVELAGSIGRHIGVTETAGPPAATGEGALVRGVDADAAEARVLLGFRIVEPPAMPAGFELTFSQLFSQAITATEGGMFVLTYESADASVVIYQERAAGSDIAAAAGFTFDVILSDGTPATYVDGAWTASSTGFVWNDTASQTLLVDRDEVRTIIRYTGARVERAFLFSIAGAMAAP